MGLWRGIVRWLLATALLLLAGVQILLLVLVLVPLPRQPLLATASVLATSWCTPVLALPAVLGLLGVLAGRRVRVRWTSWIALTTSGAALFCALAPYALAWRTARAHGEGLSLAGQFDGLNYALTPDRERTLGYARVGRHRLKMDVWLPNRPAHRPRPAVVWVHGGGWESGHRSQTPRWNQWLNDRGYAVFDVEYRLAPGATQLQQIGDVKCAIGWVRRHADRYGVDPSRIVLAGTSAGGNLALSAAYTARDVRPRPSCRTARDTSVRAVVSFYGPTDMAGLIASGADPADPAVRRFMGGSFRSAPDSFRLGSPVQLVRADVPPTLLLHGSHDRLVPVAQARELNARLAAIGARHRYVEIPWADHAFDYNWGGWGTQIARPVLARFLAAHAGP
ncbi:alpha/beta hydrolase fold domain-containing protein [Streptomyces sp. bgisy100]|uniref:alpha/beta hydrolase fold domain-containing protein n=1 Tax=Streptomyces sp. bgisy100 TaxID=3413783 RepID=UPI003D70496E